MYVAKCLCSKVVIEVATIGERIAHCHCHMCQKFHGAAFSTFVEVEQRHINWLKGKELLSRYQAENQSVRQFCQCCGSSISFESSFNRTDQTLEISLALFENPKQLLDATNVAADCHIFVESKAPWYEITDDLPQCQRYRD